MPTRLEPLPEAVIIAERLRQMAKELILEAEALEATATVNSAVAPGKNKIEYMFSAELRKNSNR